MKLFVTLAGLLAAAQADPYYGYGYLHQQNWPSVRAPGFSATCWGCRGKRSADAWGYGYAPYALGLGYARGVAGHPTGVSYTQRSPQGLRGKRDADADAYGYGYAPVLLGRGIAAHPGRAISYSNRSPQGAYGKRSADADAWGYGYAPLGLYGRGIAGHYGGGVSYSNRSPQGLGKRSADAYGYGYGRGIAAHPGRAISYSNRSPQGAYGKRSADADACGYGYAPFGYGYGLNAGYNAHPTGVSFSSVRLGKRDADAYGYGYAPALAKSYPSWPGVVAPGFESTCYGCGLGKRSADAEPAYYTQRSPQGLGSLGYGYGYGRGYYWG